LQGLDTVAWSLVAFLADRKPMVYRRYMHSWRELPSAETRLLATI
jgi:hypothetical protein